MENDLDDLKEFWQHAKQQQHDTKIPVEDLVALARQKQKGIHGDHYANLFVLTSTVMMLAVFFFMVYSLQEILSTIGISLMIGGLLARIGVEVFSLLQARKIKVDQPTAQSLSNLVAFHRLRKQIHGPITLVIVALYVLGLYAVTPEISKHISDTSVVLMHLSIPLLAVLLVMAGRRGIGKELSALEKLLEIQKRLSQSY